MMTSTLNLSIPIKPYEKVTVDAEYWTPLGEFKDLSKVNQMEAFIETLKRVREIDFLINSTPFVLKTFLKQYIRDNLLFVQEEDNHWVADSIFIFLTQFRKGTGYEFKDFVFERRVLSSGEKYKFTDSTKLFNSEKELLAYAVSEYAYSCENLIGDK